MLESAHGAEERPAAREAVRAAAAGRIPRRVPGTRFEARELPDGRRYRLINPLQATFAILNEPGARIAEAIDGNRTVAELAAILMRRTSSLGWNRALEGVVRFVDTLAGQKLLYWSDGEPPTVLETTSIRHLEEVWLNLTNRCNLRCLTCFKDAGEALRTELTTSEWVRLVDQLPELGPPRAIVSGGEPLLREGIEAVLEAMAERELEIFLITNGTVIDAERARRLAQLPRLKVQVSLDGARPQTNDAIRGRGSFARALAGARRLAELGVDVRIYPTITRLNIGDLPELEQLSHELRRDGRRFGFARFHPTGRGARNFERLYVPPGEFLQRIAELEFSPRSSTCRSGRSDDLNQYVPERVIYGVRKVNCGFGSGTLSVDADGTVYPCHWLHDPRFAAGNVRERSLADIYFDAARLERCRKVRVDGPIRACAQCDYRYFCGGGCRARALAFTGDIAGRDPDCELLRTAFDRGLWCEPMWQGRSGPHGEVSS